jgi:hypothetical protein
MHVYGTKGEDTSHFRNQSNEDNLMNHTYHANNHVWEIDLPDLLGVKDQATLSSMKQLEEWRPKA